MQGDLSPQAIRKWLLAYGLPNTSRLGELSRITGKSTHWLLTGEDDPEQDAVGYRLPVVSMNELMLSDLVGGDSTLAELAYDWINSPWPVGPKSFGVKVEDDTMRAMVGLSYPKGSIVIVEPEVPAVPPCRVVARVGNGVLFRELGVDAGMQHLRPMNQQYLAISAQGELDILGVVRVTIIRE